MATQPPDVWARTLVCRNHFNDDAWKPTLLKLGVKDEEWCGPACWQSAGSAPVSRVVKEVLAERDSIPCSSIAAGPPDSPGQTLSAAGQALPSPFWGPVPRGYVHGCVRSRATPFAPVRNGV